MSINKAKARRQRSWWRGRMAVGLAVVMSLLFGGTALAAQIMGNDLYILPRGEVVSDDLYVSGSEVIIDGTVEGDLVVMAAYVEINGVVMGDLLAAGGAVVISGAVRDDVRAAGGGVILNGSVGDDFFAAAGGGWAGAMPMFGMPERAANVPQGLLINSGATIGGDAVVAGGQGLVAGAVGGDLVAAFSNFTLSGRVAGDANLNAQQLSVLESTVVQGELSYAAENDTVVPAGVAGSLVKEEPSANAVAPSRNPIGGFFNWMLRTALILAGYLIAGWLLWTFAPRQIIGPVVVLESRPMEAGVTGLLLAVAVLPVGAALTFLAALFWGWFPGGVSIAAFIFGLSALLWLLSPLVTGFWVGRRIGVMTGAVDGELSRLLVGIAAIVLVGRVLTVIPCIGDLTFQVLFLVSLLLAVGSWFLARRRPPQEPTLLPAPVVAAA